MATSATLLPSPIFPSSSSSSTPRASTIRCLAAPSRRHLLFLAAAPSLLSIPPATAADIPLFGIRKRIEKIEEEAAEIVREGEKAVEQSIEAVEKEVEEAEKGIPPNVLQAGGVAVAEALGLLIGVSVVNAILAPERRKA